MSSSSFPETASVATSFPVKTPTKLDSMKSILKTYIETEDETLPDFRGIVTYKDHSELFTDLSTEEKTKLFDLIAEDCNWFADDYLKTVELLHTLIESGADCTNCYYYMERIIQWFGMDRFAKKEYDYLVSKGFNFSCLNKEKIKNCIKYAVEDHNAEEDKEAGEAMIHDLKSRMEVFAEDDEIDATLDCIEAAMKDYGEFNYERKGNTYISTYEVQGKKIKITVSAE